MSREWTEEDIAAFVDGALDDDAAERIAQIIEEDNEARALAEEIGNGNKLLRAAFEDAAAAPVPPSLAATLSGQNSTVIPFRNLLARRRTWVSAAAAASIAIAVALGLGTKFSGSQMGSQITLGDAPRASTLHLALETLPSGTPLEDRIVPMLTFTDASGRYCREFEVVGDLPDELEFGIACRTIEAAWHVEIIVTAPMISAADGGFAPASGPGADALAKLIEALGGSAPLAPHAEARVIEKDWRP